MRFWDSSALLPLVSEETFSDVVAGLLRSDDEIVVWWGTWVERRPTDDTRLLAMLVSKRHPLKAADSLQIAAALRWCEGETDGTAFVCLDERLRIAALDEGFDVLPETLEPA